MTRIRTCFFTILIIVLCFPLKAIAQEKESYLETKDMIARSILFDQFNQFLNIDSAMLVKALEQSIKYNYTDLIIEAHRGFGDHLKKIGLYTKAIPEYQTALNLTQKLDNPSIDSYLLKMRIANCFGSLGRIEETLNMYLALEDELEEQIQNNKIDSTRFRISKSKLLSNLGQAYCRQGAIDKGLPVLLESYNLIKRIDFSTENIYQFTKTGMAMNLSAAYLFMGDGKAAKPYILEQLNYTIKENVDFKTQAKGYGNLAYCDFLNNDYESAYKNYFKSLRISKKHHYSDVTLVTYKDLSETYLAEKEFENALLYQQRYYMLKDSIQGVEIQQNLDLLKLSYETEQKENEILELNHKNQIAKQQKLSLITALILAFIVALFLAIFYRNSQKNRKKEAILQALKLENLNQQLKFEKRDISRLALEISSKQEIESMLSDQIDKLKPYIHPEAKGEWKKLGELVQNHLQSTDTQKIFHENIEEINHAFFSKLSSQYPNLNQLDRELCSYIRLGLSNKDIAALRKVSAEAIRSNRFRLRKKLNLGSKEEVELFLQNI